MTGEFWDDLVSSALIGTLRRPPAGLTAGGVPGLPESALTPGSLASGGGLLAAAGAVTLLRRAGARTPEIPAVPAPAPDDARPLPPAAALARVGALLDTSSQHLGWWLVIANDRNLRVPGKYHAQLLAAATRDSGLRPAVLAAAGPAAPWLGGLRGEWKWATDPLAAPDVAGADPPVEAWNDGTAAERATYLAALRRRDPAGGLDALRETWPNEGYAERAALLTVLGATAGRDPRDEAFCEEALGDRRKEVRTVAAGILAQVAGSAYQARMRERTRACVAGGPGGLVVTPPVECDAAMRRDGVEPKPPAGTGERAWWLEQVVARAPLAMWAGLGGPDALLAAPVADDWALTLHRSWARAALTSGDATWAAAILRTGFGTAKEAEIHDMALTANLCEVLPPREAMAYAGQLLAGSHPDLGRVTTLLAACPSPWPRPFAEVLTAAVHRQLAAIGTGYVPHQVREFLTAVGTGVAPADGDLILALARSFPAGDETGYIAGAVTSLAETVRIRSEIYQEFQ